MRAVVEAYGPGGRSDVIDMLFESGREDVARYAEARPLAHVPGTWWNYSSGSSNVVSAIAARAVGGGEAGMRAFMRRELFDRLGMRSATARFDPAGNFLASSYVYATARDFARFGLLYLRDGRWAEERILPAGWVDHGRALTIPSSDQYGAHWWLARDGSGIFHASGYRGQYIVIAPTRDLVVVRLGNTEEALRPNVKHLLRDAGAGVSASRLTAAHDARSARTPRSAGCLLAALLWAYGFDSMGARMKTTVEIPDALAEEAKAVAARERTTLRALIEAGLRHVLGERRRPTRFRLVDASFRGKGLQPEFRDDDWQRIRQAAYEGRGG